MILNPVRSQLPGLRYASSKRKVPHIEKDLIFLGFHMRDLYKTPRCTTIPDLEPLSQVLGYLYLFKRSRLGGLVQVKALKECFEFDGYHGYSCCGSDGMYIPELWKSFGQRRRTMLKEEGMVARSFQQRQRAPQS